MGKKKIVSIEDRIPKLKQERKKKANRRLVFYLSIFLILISLIIYLQTSLSDVKEIVVKGNQTVLNEEVIKQSKLAERMNIWAIKQDQVVERLQSHPVIASAEIKRRLPGTVEITIKEYDRVGYLKKEKHYYPILENGTTLEKATSFMGDAPLIEGFTEALYFESLITELKQVPKSILNLISEIHWQPKQENKYKIMLYMNDGFVVDATIRKLAEKIQIYPSIVAQLEPGSEGIIHLGVGAYFETYQKDPEENEQDTNETEE